MLNQLKSKSLAWHDMTLVDQTDGGKTQQYFKNTCPYIMIDSISK